MACNQVALLREQLIICNQVFVSAGVRLASEQCLPIMRERDVESIVTLINEFGVFLNRFVRMLQCCWNNQIGRNGK
ncbi:hypothetical protein HYC85_026520 [Camellia sinensis]|uniref:Uncharacterized protein n=1 Tax=Camellia sinensis TaxID=4442 RepID=A0A7J7G5Z9_CAMSI|nr:hypothetical protein HYC85_026520 [Camellia sinensis]